MGEAVAMLRGRIEVAGGLANAVFEPPLTLMVGSTARSSDSVQVFPIEIEVDRVGPFAIDLTKALRHLAARYRSEDLAVEVDHPDYLPIYLEAPIPDPAAVLAGQAPLAALTLLLRPASVLEGVVSREDGDPVEGAVVLLYGFGPEGPERAPLSRDDTDSEGGFRLRFARDGTHLVVASWRPADTGSLFREAFFSEGVLPPTSAVRVLHRKVRAEPVQLQLEASRVLRGVVRHQGEPVAGAVVECAPALEGSRLTTDQGPGWSSGLLWTGDRVLWLGGVVRTGDDGRFEVHGLVALPHRLRVRHAPGIHPHTRIEGDLVQIATPPKSDVEFDLALARLEIRMMADGRPVPDATIGVTDVGMAPEIGDDVAWRTSWLETDEQGWSVCFVSPECTYFFTADDEEHFETYQHEFEAPAAGETYRIVAEMQPLRPRPALAILFEGAGADEVEVAGFGFYPPDANPRSRTPYPLRDDVRRTEDGVFRLTDLAPGTWRLHVRPGRRWHADPGAWVEAVRDVEVPESGEWRLRVPIERGGRLHLDVTDVDGRHLRATCTIRDEHEAEVPAWFVATDAFDVRCQSTTTLPGIGPCWVEPVLVPGTYRTVFEADGYCREEQQVEVKAGLPTSVRVVLEREE